MREIKFRAWDSKQKKYIDEVYPKEYMFESNDWDIPDYGDMCEAMSFFPKNPMGPTFDGRIIYEQYTGLKDKNEKEIYEGDICFYDKENLTVVYEGGGYWLRGGKNSWSRSIPMINLVLFQGHGFENPFVVGNIHENPELLK